MADEHVDLSEVDRLLRQELSIEPSPEFLPRVRARIEADEQRSHSPFEWIRHRPVFQAVFALTILLAIGWFVTRTTAPSTELPARVIADRTPPPVQAAPPAPEVAPAPPERRASFARRQGPRTESSGAPISEPEVLVDGRQRAAITAVMALVDAGKLTGESFVPAFHLAIEELEVPPIDAGPFVVSGPGTGGVLQKGTEQK